MPGSCRNDIACMEKTKIEQLMMSMSCYGLCSEK
jgi:hypothetical protein